MAWMGVRLTVGVRAEDLPTPPDPPLDFRRASHRLPQEVPMPAWPVCESGWPCLRDAGGLLVSANEVQRGMLEAVREGRWLVAVSEE